jgi:hypothetical protein
MMTQLLHVDNEKTVTGNNKPSLTPGRVEGEITYDSIIDYLGESEKLIFTYNVNASSSEDAYAMCEEHVLDVLDVEPERLDDVHNEELASSSDGDENLYVIAVGATL